MAGAPKGNKNAVRENHLFKDTLRRAIAQDNGKRLRGSIERMLTLADQGEPWAVKELADRLDGKAMQAITADIDARIDVVELIRFGAKTAATK